MNTPGFLLAVLVKEKLLRALQGKKRSHERVDSEAFLATVAALMASDVDSEKTTGKKTFRKKRAC